MIPIQKAIILPPKHNKSSNFSLDLIQANFKSFCMHFYL